MRGQQGDVPVSVGRRYVFEVECAFYERYAAWLREAQDLYRYCTANGIAVPPFLDGMVGTKAEPPTNDRRETCP